MDATSARRLMATLAPSPRRDYAKPLAMGPEAIAAADRDGRPGVSKKEALRAFEADRLAWDPAARRAIPTETRIAIDESIHPNDKSLFFKDSIEQCMEFVMRYTRTVREQAGRPDGGFGTDWKVQYNFAKQLRGIASGEQPVEGYSAFLNGGTVPPRAGDVLLYESAPGQRYGGEFHVALVSRVENRRQDGWWMQVWQANVPLGVNDPAAQGHYAWQKLEVKDGRFTLPRAETSKQGYMTDMDPVGWLHPKPEKALPGAVAEGRGATAIA